jgi:hypothetical protein
MTLEKSLHIRQFVLPSIVVTAGSMAGAAVIADDHDGNQYDYRQVHGFPLRSDGCVKLDLGLVIGRRTGFSMFITQAPRFIL